MSSITSGSRLGPYEVSALIGEGGMGQVWKARDTRLDRTVAIKVSQEKFSERFEREARAVAALNHPHVCALFDVGPDYLVMEFIEGTPLKGPLPADKIVEYAGQILDALEAAHRKGITHRDLKPGNILVTKQGIKLLDFGLARMTSGPPGADAPTIVGTVMGTPGYMAPELWDGKPGDARSDIYAFGCVLYEMKTGKPQHENAAAESVEPAALARILQRCLAKEPDQRFQNALDVKVNIGWALEQPTVATTHRRWWAAAVAMLALGVLGVWAGASSSLRQAPLDDRVLRLEIEPPEGGVFPLGSNVGGVTLSQDGKTAAYVASVNGNAALWVRSLDSITARPLAGTEGAAYPFWSPDNKSIAFFAAGNLKRVDVSGGTPLTVAEGVGNRGGAWSSDGQILIGGLASGLFQVPASGGKPSLLTRLDASRGEFSHRWPQVLPGGNFLYWTQGDKPEHTGVYAASFTKPETRALLVSTDTNALYAPGENGKDYLLWLRGGTLVAQEFDARALQLAGEPHPIADPVSRVSLLGLMNAAVSNNGLVLYSSSTTMSQFMWFDPLGKPLEKVGEPAEYNTFRLSPNGRRAATTRDKPGGANLWLLDVDRGISSLFTANSSVNNYPLWSPDGRSILFTSCCPRNLFLREVSGAGSEQRLSQKPTQQLATDWSRDGQFVLYYEIDPVTQRDLWILSMTKDDTPAANAKPKPYLNTPFNESWGRFSPESSPQWVAYQSDESGQNEIYVRSFPIPRGKIQISTGGGTYPQWGSGGRELFYVSLDNKLMAVSLKLGNDSIEPSVPRGLFTLPVVDIGWSPYDTAPDGRFLVRTRPQLAQPLTVIVNWPALLRMQQ